MLCTRVRICKEPGEKGNSSNSKHRLVLSNKKGLVTAIFITETKLSERPNSSPF